jgi:hypothetical protein
MPRVPAAAQAAAPAAAAPPPALAALLLVLLLLALLLLLLGPRTRPTRCPVRGETLWWASSRSKTVRVWRGQQLSAQHARARGQPGASGVAGTPRRVHACAARTAPCSDPAAAAVVLDVGRCCPRPRPLLLCAHARSD